MANQFLVDIHYYISQQIAQTREVQDHAESGDGAGSVSFYDGKLDELLRLREYLSEAFNLHTQRYD